MFLLEVQLPEFHESPPPCNKCFKCILPLYGSPFNQCQQRGEIQNEISRRPANAELPVPTRNPVAAPSSTANGGIRPQEYRNLLNTSQCLYCLWLWEPLWLPSHPAPTEIRSQKNQISTNPANAVLLMPHKAYSKFAICKRAYPNHFYRPK